LRQVTAGRFPAGRCAWVRWSTHQHIALFELFKGNFSSELDPVDIAA
jgi:hypothetical protein